MNLQAFSLPAVLLEGLPLLVSVLVPQILEQRVEAGPVAAAHAVEVVYLLGSEVHDGDAPVHAEVHRHHHQVVREYVHLQSDHYQYYIKNQTDTASSS